MGCSASKAQDRDATQPQRQQVKAVSVFDPFTLHPAAAVFCNEILGSIGDENKALEKENERFSQLPDRIQDVNLAFYTTSFRQEGDTFYHTYHETINVKDQLRRGNIVVVDESERLVLTINDAPAHPVEDNGRMGQVRLTLAGMQVGSFREARFYVSGADVASLVVEEDDSVRIRLRLSNEVVIEGKLDSQIIKKKALIELIKDVNFITQLTFPDYAEEPSQSKGIEFTPLSISMAVTPWLKKNLELFEKLPSPGKNIDVSVKVDLRYLIVEALGDDEYRELWNKHRTLKHRSNILSEMRNLILGVNVRHDGGSFSVTLDQGLSYAEDKWLMDVRDSSARAVTVAHFFRVDVSFSGIRLRLHNSLALMNGSNLFNENGGLSSYCVMEYIASPYSTHWRFSLIVKFNWVDFTGEEIAEEIFESFSMKMRNALNLTDVFVEGHEDDVFPSEFKATVVGIYCDQYLVKHRLTMCGLWEDE